MVPRSDLTLDWLLLISLLPEELWNNFQQSNPQYLFLLLFYFAFCSVLCSFSYYTLLLLLQSAVYYCSSASCIVFYLYLGPVLKRNLSLNLSGTWFNKGYKTSNCRAEINLIYVQNIERKLSFFFQKLKKKKKVSTLFVTLAQYFPCS